MSCANGAGSLSCRRSYHLLFSDGYWSGEAADTSAARGNVDGTAGPTVTGPNSATYTYSAAAPFADLFGDPDPEGGTLADVAMHYWKNDLRTGLTNNVPATTMLPMTFGLSEPGSTICIAIQRHDPSTRIQFEPAAGPGLPARCVIARLRGR